MIKTTRNLKELAEELRSYVTAEAILISALRRGGLEPNQQSEVCRAIKKLKS